MPKIRWGVLGTARIARILFNDAVKGSRDGVLYGIASRDFAKAREWQAQFGFTRAYEGYAALIDDADIDAVYVPLPNHLHAQWCLRAIGAGKHVFCEKPATLNAAECARVVRAAQAAGVVFVENYSFLYHPQSAQLKEILRQGQIGRVVNLVCSFHNYMRKRDGNIRLRPEMGGGVLMDLGSYMVALSRFIFDSEPLSVVGLGDPDPTYRVDLTFNGLLEFPAGRTATFATSFDNPGWQYLRVLGTEGELVLPTPLHPRGVNDGIHLRRETVVKSGAGRFFSDEHTAVPPLEPFTAVVDAVAAAIHDGSALIDPWDAVRNMRVIDALKLSAQEGRRIAVDEIPVIQGE